MYYDQQAAESWHTAGAPHAYFANHSSASERLPYLRLNVIMYAHIEIVVTFLVVKIVVFWS